MKNFRISILAVVIFLAFAGCTPAAAPPTATALPTAAATRSATPRLAPTLPAPSTIEALATVTPFPSATTVPTRPPIIAPTNAPSSATRDATAATLAPSATATWTPFGVIAVPPLPNNVSIPPECAVFALRREATTVPLRVGQVTAVTWTPLAKEGMTYRVWVNNPARRFVFNESTYGDRMVLPARLFDAPGTYFVTVIAYQGETPICQFLEDVLVVRS